MNRRFVSHRFSLLHVDRVELDQKWNYQQVISPYYRIYYIESGLGQVETDQQTWTLEPGFLYLIPSFTLCNLRCTEQLCQYFIHFFEESVDAFPLFHHKQTVLQLPVSQSNVYLIHRLLELNPNRKIYRSDNPKVYEKNVFYQEYEELNNQSSYANFMETQGILLQLMGRFLDISDASISEPSTGAAAKIATLLQYIQVHLAARITVQELARQVNLHPDYLSRLFLQVTGQRPLSYLHQKRIQRAQYLMVTSKLSLSQIASETGFDNLPHFSKTFKQITQLSPGKYRSQLLSQPH